MKINSFVSVALIFFLGLTLQAFGQSKKQWYFEIKIYHFQNSEQEKTLDTYFRTAFIPSLHRNGIKTVGVFKPLANDTAQDKKIVLLIPYRSVKQFESISKGLITDKLHSQNGDAYLNAASNKAPYKRFESILLKAFEMMPTLQVPVFKNAPEKRIYELRSYEGPTDKLFLKKVEMFNQGGEIGLFKRLGFNAVFYGSVLAGSRMPNLMYMTSFEDKASRDTHWKAFGADPEWKKLSALDRYKNTVSKIEIIFMHPTEYSDI